MGISFKQTKCFSIFMQQIELAKVSCPFLARATITLLLLHDKYDFFINNPAFFQRFYMVF